MRVRLIIVIIFIIILASFYFLGDEKSDRSVMTVKRVIDGDTIEMANGDRVRLLGIDSPERGQMFYEESIDELRKLEGRTVSLERDSSDRDRYGRYLRYVFLGDYFVNAELVKNGFASVFIMYPNNKHQNILLTAESHARESGRGIWKSSDIIGCIALEEFHYDASGYDNKNLNDEFFVIGNNCENTIGLDGWTVRNTALRTFKLSGSIGAGSQITVHTGEGKSSSDDLFLGSDQPMWNNERDSIYIRDSYGGLVVSEHYDNNPSKN